MNKFDFREYDSLKELLKAIYYRNLKIEDAEGKQDEFVAIFNALEKYNPRKSDYVTARKNILRNAKNIYDGREMIINAFTNCFHLVLKMFLKMNMRMNFTLNEN